MTISMGVWWLFGAGLLALFLVISTIIAVVAVRDTRADLREAEERCDRRFDQLTGISATAGAVLDPPVDGTRRDGMPARLGIVLPEGARSASGRFAAGRQAVTGRHAIETPPAAETPDPGQPWPPAAPPEEPTAPPQPAPELPSLITRARSAVAAMRDELLDPATTPTHSSVQRPEAAV